MTFRNLLLLTLIFGSIQVLAQNNGTVVFGRSSKDAPPQNPETDIPSRRPNSITNPERFKGTKTVDPGPNVSAQDETPSIFDGNDDHYNDNDYYHDDLDGGKRRPDSARKGRKNARGRDE